MEGLSGLGEISTIQPQGRLEDISGGLSLKGKAALAELIRRKSDLAELALSLLPGSGEVISAQESREFATSAYKKLGKGDIGSGLFGLGESLVSAIGAVPLVGGVVRLSKKGRKITNLGFFPKEFYHGTAGKLKGKTLDLKMAGETGTEISKEGIFLTPSPKAASKYAELASERRFKPASVLPVRVRAGQVGMIESVENLTQLEVKGALLDAKEVGFDSVVLKDYPHPGGIVADTLVVFDPARLRSRFAKFDPRKLEKKDLLAGVAPFIILGAAKAEQTQENKTQKSQ